MAHRRTKNTCDDDGDGGDDGAVGAVAVTTEDVTAIRSKDSTD